MSEEQPSPLLYSERDDWKDVQPIEQSDLEQPLVPIFYPPDYQDATDYFRGIVAIGEHSERVLELTERIIRINPAHYSVWQYRYATLMALKSPLDKELELMDELALNNMKFYQVWHHRKLLMIQIKKPLPELTYLSNVLSHDVKNYHTWAYRQWLLTHFDSPELWEHELPFVDLLLTQDIRNNSAWHHRFFVVWDTGAREGEEDREEVLRRELRYTKEKIAKAPNNLSAWNYLRGILDRTGKKYGDQELDLETFVKLYTVKNDQLESEIAAQEKHDDEYDDDDDEEEELIDLNSPRPSKTAHLPCALALEFLADLYLEDTPAKDIKKAQGLFETLRDQRDTMRKRYWDYRIKSLPSTTS